VADEITYSAAVAYSKSGRTASRACYGESITVSGGDYVMSTQVIGTSSSEAIAKGEITTPGVFFVENRDATNYIEIDAGSFTSGNGTVKVKAGEHAFFRFAATTPHALANTGSVEIAYLLIED
jgi:hypothetical protein